MIPEPTEGYECAQIGLATLHCIHRLSFLSTLSAFQYSFCTAENMGNKASAVMSAVKPGEAISNVNKQLGLEEDQAVVEKKKEVERGALKKERDLRQKERVTEFRTKQVERDIRKASLQEKWNRSHQQNS
jgi:hypothetical protein